MRDQETPRKHTIPNDTATLTITLFVYGTLKRGFWNHDRFCRNAIDIRPATTWGRLYLLPASYPALEVPESSILAHGTAAPPRRCRHTGPSCRPRAPTRRRPLTLRRLGPDPRGTHHLSRSRPRPPAHRPAGGLPPEPEFTLRACSGPRPDTEWGYPRIALCRRRPPERLRRAPPQRPLDAQVTGINRP